jgi:hypothetical protein
MSPHIAGTLFTHCSKISFYFCEQTALSSNDIESRRENKTSAMTTSCTITPILNLSGFEAVEGACCLLLAASEHVKSEDEALGVVDGAVFLAHTHILRLLH